MLRDADFVVLTFTGRNAHFLGINIEISAKYGVRMCSSGAIAICDGPHGPRYRLRVLKTAGIMSEDAEAFPPLAEAKLTLRITGGYPDCISAFSV